MYLYISIHKSTALNSIQLNHLIRNKWVIKKLYNMKQILFTLFILMPYLLVAQDSYLCSQVKSALDILKVDYESVEIADGRKNGGGRNLIISYRTSYDHDTQIQELIAVLESSYVLNKNSNARLDEVTAVVGSKSGISLAVITTKVYNVNQYMIDRNAEKYVKTWTVLRFDKNYLPQLLALAKQA